VHLLSKDFRPMSNLLSKVGPFDRGKERPQKDKLILLGPDRGNFWRSLEDPHSHISF
jgi:hypothetical protein